MMLLVEIVGDKQSSFIVLVFVVAVSLCVWSCNCGKREFCKY